MIQLRTKTIIGIVFLLIVSGCGGNGSEDDSAPPAAVQVDGAVQKGPFVVGSTVTLNLLTPNALNTNSTAVTNTIDDLGRFNFSLDEGSDLLELSATGYYRNEITGELSQGTITLRSVIGLSDQEEQTAYINLLTHLTSQRIKKLISESDLQFEDAQSRAESEFLIAFSEVIPNSAENDFTSLSIYDDELSSGSSYLLSVSSILYRYALNQSNTNSTNPDAELTQLLNELEADFGDDGDIGDAPLLESLRAIIPEIDPSIVSSNVDDWIDGVDGFERVDINEYLDTDLDGVFNSIDTDDDDDGVEDELDTLPYQQSFIVADQEVEVNEDQSVEVDIETNNPLDTEVSVEILSSASNGAVSGSYPDLTYTPNANFEGIDTFSYQLTQGEISSEIATVSLSIVGENDAPSIAGTPTTEFMAHNTYSFAPTILDIENDSLELSIQNLPSWAGFNDQTGEISGSPTNEDVGLYENILLSANDGNLTTEFPSFDIEVQVNPYELGFLVENQELETDEDNSINIDISSNNPLGIDIDLTIPQGPSHGSVQGDYPELTYIPNENYNGADTFKYRLSQDIIVSGEVTITINTLPVNDAPTISGTPENSVTAFESYSFVPTASDLDEDELEFSVQNLPAWASLDGETGEISGIPENDDAGIYQDVTVGVSDGSELVYLSPFNLTIQANPWRSLSGLPSSSRGGAAVEYGGLFYYFGGTASGYNAVWEYDPTTDIWTEKSPMPKGIHSLDAHVVNDKIFIISGYGNGGFVNDTLQYDPLNDTWETKSPRPTYRYVFSSATVNGLIYVIGGQGTIDDGPWRSGVAWTFKDYVEIYDPESDTWSTGQSAPTVLANNSACSVDGKIYVFGGYVGGGHVSDVRVYTPENDSWSTNQNMDTGKEAVECSVVNGEIFIFGGRNSAGAISSVQSYDTAENSWAVRTQMTRGKYWFPALTYEGKVYIFGGSDGSEFNSVELYNPFYD